MLHPYHIFSDTYEKELFSKLRFSYVEQVTKEKFLRAIVGDPPLVVGHNENVELEGQLAEVKAELKSRKEEVRIIIEDMEKMGRDLASREFLLPLMARKWPLSNICDRIQKSATTEDTTFNAPRIDREP